MAELQVQRAREAGALVLLRFALHALAVSELFAGELDRCRRADRGGQNGRRHHRQSAGRLRHDAPRCPTRADDAASRLITAARDEAWSLGQDRIVNYADYASAVLSNGLARHDVAALAAREAFDRDAWADTR